MCKCTGKGLSIVSNFIVADRVEVGDCYKVGKEHVDEGVVTLLMTFAPYAHAFVGRVKSKNEMGKYLEFRVRHVTVVT